MDIANNSTEILGVTASLAITSDPPGDLNTELKDLIVDKFRYAIFADEGQFDEWINTECHYTAIQSRCQRAGRSSKAIPEARKFFSDYVLKLECDLTDVIIDGGTGEKSGCCLRDYGN